MVRLRFVPLALLLTAIVEIAVFVLVASAIGFGWAVLAVLATTLLGSALLRREGVRAWRRFRITAEAGQPPGGEATYGVAGLGAALLLAVPGFVTDLCGLVLLIPPARRVAAGRVQRAMERRMSSAAAGDLFGPRRVRVWVRHPAAQRPAPDSPPPPGPQADRASGPAPEAGPAIEGEIVGIDERGR